MPSISSSSQGTTSAAEPSTRQTTFWRHFGPGGLAAAAALALVTSGMFAWNASLQEENQTLQGQLEGRQKSYALQSTGAAAAPLEGSIEGADAVAVTVEPSGGSSSPTSDPLMTANV